VRSIRRMRWRYERRRVPSARRPHLGVRPQGASCRAARSRLAVAFGARSGTHVGGILELGHGAPFRKAGGDCSPRGTSTNAHTRTRPSPTPATAAWRPSATGADAPPAITRSAGRGPSSEAHWIPQRQHVSSWRAIGPWQERHKRGKCRSRMTQRSFVREARDAACPAVVRSVATAVRAPVATSPSWFSTTTSSPSRAVAALCQSGG
jgi:hypothetical protein